MKRKHLSAVIIFTLFAGTGTVMAQSTGAQQTRGVSAQQGVGGQASVSSTSKVTAVATKRARKLEQVDVTASMPTLGGGLMSEQDAPKAVSTITRAAIQQGAPGGTFVQAIQSIPGVFTSTDDYTGLNDGDYSIRGFTSDEVGTTVNGAPINDSGNYRVYATEYGDTENMGDITVQQGWPDVDQPISGAAGGSIGWATIDPTHKAGLDFSQTFGGNNYHRTFLRANTGDLGPVRSWLSYSNNETHLWNGPGKAKVTKVDGKSLWTINDRNSISFSLQYNREVKNSYLHLTKQQAAEKYDQNYSGYWSVPENLKSTSTSACGPDTTYNACYYKLHINPYTSWMASADGEFTLTDNLHLSVVPYFQYGSGGGSGATAAYESIAGNNQYLDVNADLNGDGVVSNGSKGLVYSLSQNFTHRPGIIAKLSQDFGLNDTLVYGVWWERPREQQDEVFSLIDPSTGVPSDIWGRYDVIRYPNGVAQKAYGEYTTTTTEKAFATNTWTPSDQWTVTAGLSYVWAKRKGYDFEYPGADYGPSYKQQFGGTFSGTYHKWSPTVGVKFQLDDANQFYFGMGRTFRTPVNGALAQNGAAAYYNASNPWAGHSYTAVNKPETATSADLGWRFYTSRVSASVDAYAANFHNKQVSGYDENSGQTVFTELPNVHMRGLNGEASVKLDSMFTLYGSYTYTVSRQQDNVNAGTDGIYYTRGKTLTNTPRNSGYVRLGYKQGPVWASLNAKYRGAVWGDWSNTEKVGGYTTFNLSAGYHFPDFSSSFRKPYIKLNVFNLTNHRAFTWASSNPFLASSAGTVYDVNGTKLYASPATYSVLEERTWMVTFGASFF
ncbi:TonB-dependent receptor [Dyella sp. A6]|uniref:TonB-dependent receptor n=1 Tax=Dyella aluminiiresistens TaxID=3069105 RepID=UPI002E7633D8|nr:TonB-dependent receptor [Dyella sp. A6]